MHSQPKLRYAGLGASGGHEVPIAIAPRKNLLIQRALKEDPKASPTKLAASIGTNPEYVGLIRRKLEAELEPRAAPLRPANA
jgi:hypothetical protein